MKHFLKEIIQTPVIGPDGKPVQWERLADSYGVLAVEDGSPIAEWLEECARNHRYGVRVITQAEYEDYKKKLPYTPSESSLSQQIRILEMPQLTPPVLRPATELPVDQNSSSQVRDPFKEHVADAVAKVSARRAAESGNAVSAEGQDGFTPETANEAQQRVRKSAGRPRKSAQ